MILTLDVETLGTTDQEVIESFRKQIKPPATYKKPESIAEWMKENEDAELAKMVANTSLDGMYGRIACICYKFDDDEQIYCEDDDDEKRLLENFYSHVYDRTTTVGTNNYLYPDPTVVCGHNIAGFDLPFLKHRSIINKVKPVPAILAAMNARPWDKVIADTMLMWSSDPHKRGSMDRICKALGIPGKGDFDGSMVAATWPVDRQKVIDYCKDDVRRTVEMYKRMMFL